MRGAQSTQPCGATLSTPLTAQRGDSCDEYRGNFQIRLYPRGPRFLRSCRGHYYSLEKNSEEEIADLNACCQLPKKLLQNTAIIMWKTTHWFGSHLFWCSFHSSSEISLLVIQVCKDLYTHGEPLSLALQFVFFSISHYSYPVLYFSLLNSYVVS
jgi:hypothetical protein